MKPSIGLLQLAGVAGLLASCGPGAASSPPSSATGSGAPSTSGTAVAWGSNDLGILGFGTSTGPQRCGPQGDACATTPLQVRGISGVSAVSAGDFYSMALRTDGTVWAWGDNRDGELGDGTTTDRSSPIQVHGLPRMTAIAAGPAGELASEHSLALASDGTVWAWGTNLFGQLGDGTTTDRNTPVQVRGLAGVSAIAAGGEYSLALRSDGSVWTWGDNRTGKLGVGIDSAPDQCLVGGGRYSYPCAREPVRVPGLGTMRALAAGSTHSLALATDGTVWSWGNNAQGELGDGTTVDRDTPVHVPGPSGVMAVAGGDFDSLALTAAGVVWAWGDNSNGELGDGTTSERDSPAQVQAPPGVVSLAAGSTQSLALTSKGAVWAWGSNAEGELGDGTMTGRTTPGLVPGLTGVTAVAAGLEYSLALSAR